MKIAALALLVAMISGFITSHVMGGQGAWAWVRALSLIHSSAWAARVGPAIRLNSPRCALVMGVRAVETMTASRISVSVG